MDRRPQPGRGLTPPPRVERIEPRSPDPTRIEPGSSSRSRLRVLQILFVALLFIGLGAVFVLLPRWADEHGPLAVASGEEEAPDLAPTALSAPVDQDLESPTSGSTVGVTEATAVTTADRPPTASASLVEAGPRPPTPTPTPTPAGSPLSAAAPPAPSGFVVAMSDALGALEEERWSDAKASFERALELDATSADAREGRDRAEAALALRALADHQGRGRDFEEREAWAEALAEYEAALAIDASVRFGLDGRERARARAEIEGQIVFHANHPDRLSTEEVLREARAWLTRAEAIADPGPLLRGQIADLGAAIERAATPVPVVLESDELTEVTVYRVGRLGTFDRRTLELRPGTYTVIGQRKGYRDVRRQLVVTAGTTPAPTVVRCEEAI